jgi:DNA-3-methyladenine glycosylase
MRASERLPRSFFQRDPCAVARALLGQRLVRRSGERRVSGIIVETEAYLGIADKAAHTYGGRRTRRNAAMWGDGGHAYVYFIYGMHHCVNVVAGRDGEPVAVLIRALEPDAGLETMQRRRRRARRDTDLCSGPARLCQALGISREHDGADLVAGSTLFLERLRARALPARKIGSGPRIGVAYAEEWRHHPLRYWIRGNPHVSG